VIAAPEKEDRYTKIASPSFLNEKYIAANKRPLIED
jgi:hypothetical protein